MSFFDPLLHINNHCTVPFGWKKWSLYLNTPAIKCKFIDIIWKKEDSSNVMFRSESVCVQAASRHLTEEAIRWGFGVKAWGRRGHSCCLQSAVLSWGQSPGSSRAAGDEGKQCSWWRSSGINWLTAFDICMVPSSRARQLPDSELAVRCFSHWTLAQCARSGSSSLKPRPCWCRWAASDSRFPVCFCVTAGSDSSAGLQILRELLLFSNVPSCSQWRAFVGSTDLISQEPCPRWP